MANKFSIEAIFKGTDGMSKVIAGVEGRMNRASSSIGGSLKDIDKANSKVISGFADLAKQALVVGAVVGSALAAGLTQVVTAGAAFEQSITNVGAVMGKSRNQIQDLEKAAMSLGVTTQFSSSEVAEAMEFMAKKGFDSAEILQGIPGVLNAVAASGQGMAEVATVVGSSIRGFGLDAGKAGHVADVLALAAERTGATITDLGSALATAAPTAKTLGVSLEDTTAAVGLLQKMGIDASTAGSATATMLAKITKPSKEAATQMAALGIKFSDATGNMLPFRDVLGQFVKAGDKAGGNMKRMAFLAELVGLRGDKAALGLADMAKSGDFDKLSDSLKNADGYAEKVAKIRLDTTQGSWKLLTSTIEVVETKLFGLGSGALRSVIDATNAWLGANQDLIVSKFADWIGTATWGVQLFGHGVVRGFDSASGALKLFLGPFRALAGLMGQTGTWPSTVESLGRAFGFLGVVAASFLLFTLAVKGARAAMFAFELAQKAVTAVIWLGNAAVTAYAFVTDGAAVATGLNTAATVAGRIATLASTIALGAKNVVTFVAFAATTDFTLAQVASKIATIAVTAVTWLWNYAVGAWTAVTAIASQVMTAYSMATDTSTAATEGATAATDLANLSMGTFILTLGAALAAVGALYAAYTQWKALEKESGGWEGVKAGVGGVLSGEGYAKGVDDYENEQARDDAAGRGDYGSPQGAPSGDVSGAYAAPQVASPTESITNAYSESSSTGEITVRAVPGATAAVTKKPKGFGLNMAPSGSL
jgi:TP901 family phage tail tape measure protein